MNKISSPRFSVIMPVYNAQATVGQSMTSVLHQSFTDFEVIAIDDGSQDKSLAILLDFAAKDNRVRVIARENSGVAATRNFGIQNSGAVLLSFLDADDVWHPEKLARHDAFHRVHQNLAVSYARIAFIANNTQVGLSRKTVSTIPVAALTLQEVIAENPICTTSNMVATRATFDLIGGFREDMSFAEDQEWLARAAHMKCIVRGLDDVLVDYRLSPDGLSLNLAQMHAGWRSLFEQYGDPADRSAAEALYCRYLARRALRSGASAAQARDFAMQGLRMNAAAFLHDTKRGWGTLLAACVAPLLTREIRRRAFA